MPDREYTGGAYNSGYGASSPKATSAPASKPTESRGSSSGISSLANAIKSSVQAGLGQVRGPVNSPSKSIGGFSNNQFGGQRYSPATMFSDPNRSSSALASIINNAKLSSSNPRGQVDSVLRSMGYANPIGRAGMVGTFDHESGMRPGVINKSEDAFGLAQWRDGRQSGLKAYAEDMGMSPTDLGLQAAFAGTELANDYPTAYKGVMGAESIPQAVAAMNDYERPAGYKPGGNPADVHGWESRVKKSQQAFGDINQGYSPLPPGSVAQNVLNNIEAELNSGIAGIPIPRQNPLTDTSKFKYVPGRDRDYVFKGMDPQVISKIVATQEAFGAPLTATSGHRNPLLNARVGGAGKSQHMQGNAIDISLPGATAEQTADLIRAGKAQGFTGIGGYRPGKVHFDIGPERAWGPSTKAASIGQLPKPMQDAIYGKVVPASHSMAAAEQLERNQPAPQSAGDWSIQGAVKDAWDYSTQKAPQVAQQFVDGAIDYAKSNPGEALSAWLGANMRGWTPNQDRGSQDQVAMLPPEVPQPARRAPAAQMAGAPQASWGWQQSPNEWPYGPMQLFGYYS